MSSLRRGCIVLGTDTGVGKTLVTALLGWTAREVGWDWVPMKPVQTGGVWGAAGRLTAPDLDWVLAVMGGEPDPAERELMNPYVFELPASPHLAAECAGVEIERGRLEAAFRALAARHEGVVVEGAGGLLVPGGRDWTLADLWPAWNLPVVLVARAGLGTINHTLLTVEALRRRGLTAIGIFLNQPDPGEPGRIERDNVRFLAEWTGIPVWGVLPYWPGMNIPRDGAVMREELRAHFAGVCAGIRRKFLEI